MPQLIADADLPEDAPASPPTPQGPFARTVFLIGSLGLIVAAGADALAVLGRHIGFRLIGSIEIVQAAVVLIASAAVIGATLLRTHAEVHLFTSRLKPATAARLARFANLLGALAFAAVAAGSIIVAADLWNGAELTELLAIPMRPFRLIWIGASLLVAALFATRAFGRSAR